MVLTPEDRTSLFSREGPRMNLPIQTNDIQAVVEADRAHVWHHLIQHKPFETIDPRIMVEGRGMRVWDATGKEHLDAVSGGVWTVNVGYGRESIADAVRDQLVKMNYFANSAGSIPGALFAKKLIEKMPGMSRVYYSNSGSEANEKAFKMIRQISHRHHGGRKYKILYRERDYHGSTHRHACPPAASRRAQRAIWPHTRRASCMVPHCLEVPKRSIPMLRSYGLERAADAIEEVILREGPDTVGGLCLEPITAGGGVITPPAGLLGTRVQEICAEIRHSPAYRRGGLRRRPDRSTWFGYQNYGIEAGFRDHGQGCGERIRGDFLHWSPPKRVFEHVQGKSVRRSDGLFPRYLDLRRLHRRPRRSDRKHADHRRRRTCLRTREAMGEQADGQSAKRFKEKHAVDRRCARQGAVC
jgi:taurine-pyruvate aminotransferase